MWFASILKHFRPLLLSVLICVHLWIHFYRTNVNCAGPVPLTAWRYAIVSPA